MKFYPSGNNFTAFFMPVTICHWQISRLPTPIDSKLVSFYRRLHSSEGSIKDILVIDLDNSQHDSLCWEWDFTNQNGWYGVVMKKTDILMIDCISHHHGILRVHALIWNCAFILPKSTHLPVLLRKHRQAHDQVSFLFLHGYSHHPI